MSRLLLCALLIASVGCSDDDRAPLGDGSVSEADGITADASLAAEGGALVAQCPVTGYAPCGGDLAGTWRFVSFCPEDQAAADALFEHPYDNLEACKDRTANTVVGRIITTGTLSFDALEVTIVTTSKTEVSYGFTDACLAAAISTSGDSESTCLSMAANGRLTCSYEAAYCSCSATLPGPDENATASYQLLDATTLQLSEGETASFCQAGDVLIFDWQHHPISWRYWVLER